MTDGYFDNDPPPAPPTPREERLAEQENVRQLIRVREIVEHMQKQVMGELPTTERMDATDVKIATTLLNKVLPSLKQIDMDAMVEHDGVLEIRITGIEEP